jgi:hypothetical protein
VCCNKLGLLNEDAEHEEKEEGEERPRQRPLTYVHDCVALIRGRQKIPGPSRASLWFSVVVCVRTSAFLGMASFRGLSFGTLDPTTCVTVYTLESCASLHSAPFAPNPPEQLDFVSALTFCLHLGHPSALGAGRNTAEPTTDCCLP